MTPRHTIRFDAEGYATCEEHNWTSTEPGDVALKELAEHTDHAAEDAAKERVQKQ
jgi:hypothetical protein